MSRPARAFTAESFELEGRLLLTAGAASTHTKLSAVWFDGAAPPGEPSWLGKFFPAEVVSQDAGEATVTLSRSNTVGSLRVEVTTDPSPYVGVNVGAVDQTVTFADGQRQATLTVPILPGARNPGEVVVNLNIKPIDPAKILSDNLVLTVKASASTLPPTTLQFENATSAKGTSYAPVQVVTQQAGEATVTLSRSDSVGSLRVEVTTGPSWPSVSSPYVGVNAGAVDQTVTFADGQSQATVTVPILAGAPNPGEVDVNLDAKIIDPAPVVPPTLNVLDLRIVASDPTAPPKVVSLVATPQEIVLSFNKPMNPVGASNVKNYSVSLVNDSAKSWPLKSAEYDPATQTVTLIPKHQDPSIGFLTGVTQMNRVRTSIRGRHRSNAAPGLTDLQGNPINADTTPGQVGIRVTEPMITGSF